MASGQGSAAGNQSPPGGIDSIIGSRVYVPDGEHVWVPATVTKVLGAFKFEVHVEQCTSAAEIEPCSDGITAVVDVAGPQFGGTFCLPLQNEETSDGGGVGDICSLRHIHEAAVLDTLRRRFEANLPYSYAGKVCIAVNPYERPDIYGEHTQRTYETASKRAELPPHVYATSAQALKMANAFGADQSILVTGESGAGKTKTVKFLAHYLVGTTADCSRTMKRKVFLSTFLLESFGNANTPRNNNSSRFAKLMRLRIDQHGQLSGIEVIFFLLEDNRVVLRPSGERNFHILYQLLAAPASFKNPLHLEGKSSDFFRYTDRGTDQRGAMDLNVDARSFGLTIHALNNSLVTDEKISTLFSLLSGVLHLGQVDFHDGTGEADRAVWYSDANDLSVSAEMFGVPRQELGEYLTHETRILATSAAKVPLSPAAAHSRANSLAKEIYSRIFGWLVRTINNTTGDTTGGRKVTINLFDTFGYENNKHNGFEQLCINYIDEKLQQFFVQDVFNALQTEHYIEGVSRMYVDFQDNAAILAIIEDPPSANCVDPKQQRGLLHVLADHCRHPRGKGETFISEVLETFRQDANFEAGPFATGRHFAVRHSMGTVMYDAENFVEKNRVRKMADKGVRLLAASKNELLRELFRNGVDGVMQHPDGSLRHQETLGCKLRRKLHAVKCAIERTDVQYVRCINPNSSQSKDDFDAHKVVEQLRAGGITEMAQVMQSVYSTSMEDTMFLQHYAEIADFGAGRPGGARGSPSSQCSLILEQNLGSEKRDRAFFVGPNKVFLADGIFEKLEHRRRKVLMTKSAISHRFSKLHEKCLRLPIATYLLIWRDIGRFISLYAAMDPSKSNLRQKVLRFAAAGQYVVRCVDYCTARNIVPPAEVLGNLEDKVFKLCDFARNTARGIEPWRQLQDEQTRQKWPQSQEEKEDLLRHLTLFLAVPQQRGRNESGPNNITRRLASEKSISNEIPPHGDDGDFRERGGDCNTDHGTSQMRHVSKLDSGVPGNSNSLSPRSSGGGEDTAGIDGIPSKTLGQQALFKAKRDLRSGSLSGGGAECFEGKQAGKQGGEIKSKISEARACAENGSASARADVSTPQNHARLGPDFQACDLPIVDGDHIIPKPTGEFFEKVWDPCDSPGPDPSDGFDPLGSLVDDFRGLISYPQCLEVVHKHSGDLRRARTELRRWESRTHVHGETREHRDVGHWEPFGEEEKTRFDLAILLGILDRNKSPENVLWNVQKAMPGRSMTELQHHQVIWEKTQAFEKFEKNFRKREKECYVCHKGNTRFTCAAFACDRAIHAKCCKHKTTQKAIGAIASTGEAGMAHKGKKKNSLPKVTYDLYCGQGCYDRASDADADAGAASPVSGPSSVSTATARTAVPAPASALSPVCSVISGGLSQCSRAQLPFGSAWRCTEPACTDPSPGAMPTVCQACEGDLHRLCGMEGNAGLRLCSSCGTTHEGKRSSS